MQRRLRPKDEQSVGRTGHARQEGQEKPNDAAGGHSPSAGRLRTQRLEPERGNARAGKASGVGDMWTMMTPGCMQGARGRVCAPPADIVVGSSGVLYRALA